MNSKPVILVAPLDWGLGHASRMVPVIRELLRMKGTVILAADGNAGRFLREFFPDLPMVKLRSRRIRYPLRLPAWLGILIQTPFIFTGIFIEKRASGKLVRRLGITHIISDNRFGLWNPDCRSLYLTHQISVKLPAGFRFMEYPLYRLHAWFISKFDHCWIPDYPEGPGLAGALVCRFSLPPKAVFTGPLSHLSQFPDPPRLKSSGHVLILLSGPEPQRSLLEKKLLKQLSAGVRREKFILVRGIPGESGPGLPVFPQNLETHAFLTSEELRNLIYGSRLIICRSGYSTIMDLAVCRKRAVLIPTPGQTEQEYLACRLSELGAFFSMKQKAFCLDTALREGEKYSPEVLSEMKCPDLYLLLKEFLSE